MQVVKPGRRFLSPKQQNQIQPLLSALLFSEVMPTFSFIQKD
jgi:hypothetical protein